MADDKLVMFFLLFFFQKTGFDISCKFSPLKTVCMKCQNVFSGKNKKNIAIKICHLLKILPRVLRVFGKQDSVSDVLHYTVFTPSIQTSRPEQTVCTQIWVYTVCHSSSSYLDTSAKSKIESCSILGQVW